ncbi:MAG: integrase core domain-containing protein [Parvularculaceae bacterium]
MSFYFPVKTVDWATRKVLSWRVSNTMHAEFCVEALKDALARFGKPAIFNTDQGSQFTSADWTLILSDAKVKISMDGRGRFLDNIFIERLWRSLKQEAIYLTEIEDGFHAERIIDNWFDFYNTLRPHTALQNQTPDQAYHLSGMTKLAA